MSVPFFQVPASAISFCRFESDPESWEEVETLDRIGLSYMRACG